jgi:RHS repeat-associated protein
LQSGKCGDISTVTDGLGRLSQTQLNSDPSGTTYTLTTYDGLGRVSKVYNPTRCSSITSNCNNETTWGYTAYTYDALGRTTQVTESDNSTVVSIYTGRAAEVTDEGNGGAPVQRISQVDGLGRLTSVCEVTSATQLGSGGAPGACGQDIVATGFLTTYGYDALGNLSAVNQGTLGQRTFAYDSLSRLLCAANPETWIATCPTPDNGSYTAGTTRYAYDANGNVITRTRPAPNQINPSNTVATTYTSDTLNRLTQKSYNDGVTPQALFGYDQTSLTMGPQQFNITNSIGRLSWECTTAGSSCPTMNAFSYDPLGRVGQLWTSWQHVNGVNIVLSYDYDLLGDELDYYMGTTPHGSTELVSAYNGAGRLKSLTTPTFVDSTNPANLLTGVQYDPLGHVISGTLANGLSLSSAYDARGRVIATAVGTTCSSGNCSTNKYRFTTSYAPNSDILSSTDTVNGNWTYTYDTLNRLSTAVATNGKGCSWDYDRYGNRWHQNMYSGSCLAPQYSFTGNNNHIDQYSGNYDAVGNLLNDGSHSYLYDAENRIVSVDGGATTYVYDAEGRRFSKTTGSNTVATVYDREGRPLVRSSFAPGELYAAGMHLGTYIVNSGHTDSIFYYDHADWLGTERARTNLAGTACETIASLPFGDNQTISGTCGDISPLHFTGKERDTESNLDYFGARHYESASGCFMVPDPVGIWIADLTAPQSWNLYSYALNNPLKYTDPTGLYCYYGDTSEGSSDWGDAFQYDFSGNTGECSDNGGQWFGDPSTTVNVNGDTGNVDIISVFIGNNGTSNTQTFHDQGSFYTCVRSGMDHFSLQSGVQNISGGRLGNSWLAGAFLGNSVQSVGDTIQLLAQGQPGPAISTGGGEAFADSAGSIATKAALKVPNVAITVGAQATASLEAPGVSATTTIGVQASANLPFGTVAQGGANTLSKALGLFGMVKLPYDLSVASFSGLVCSIGR